MTTSAKTSFRTQLQYGDAATPELFTTLAEVRTIEPGEESAEPIEIVSHDSGTVESVSGGVTDSGEFTAEALFANDATDTAVRAALGGAAGNWQICFPDFGARTAAFTIDADTEILTSAAHGLTTGQPIQVSTSSALPAGLTAATTYWVHVLGDNTFTLHTTNAGAVADTGLVTVTTTGTGTQTLQIGTRVDFAGLVTSHKFGTAQRGNPLAITIKMRATGAQTVTS
ncbi:MAG TPA: hypothetical protein VM487_17335 [Phycisphaerae bacterium]|nr:hypothetical protein [Phycisphaerae bacterium]